MMRQAGLSLRVRQCFHNCLAVESPYIDKPLGGMTAGLSSSVWARQVPNYTKSNPTLKRLNLLGISRCETVVLLQCVEHFDVGFRLVSNTSTATGLLLYSSSEVGCFQIFHTEIREQPDLARPSIAVSEGNIQRARNKYKLTIGRHHLQFCNRLPNGHEINARRVKCHHNSVHIH